MSVIAKALWYIESHLSGDLSLDAVADVVGVSRFHLSRAFSTGSGCALAAHVRARRLSEAARSLASGAPDILAVALDAGYGSHEAFTRAFRQQFGLTPEQVRDRADTTGLALLESTRMNAQSTLALAAPRIATRDALLIAGIGQRYGQSKDAIPAQWDRFVQHLGSIPGQKGTTTYGVVYNTDDSGSCDYLAGVEVSEFAAAPSEFTRHRIPPHTYAVFTSRDHVSAIGEVWRAVWDHGLADAGRQASDGPAFEQYGEEFDGRTGNGGFEIWVPINA